MFTGIIKEIGTVGGLGRSGSSRRLDIKAGAIYETAGIGDSVAVNGACLTLTGKNKNVLSFDVMDETLRKTSLGALANNDPVNLEGAVKADGTFGGHFVTGHIDCVGKIREISKRGEFKLAIEVPKDFMHLFVEKGSVCVDGVSLTVGGIRNDIFSVYIIPHTLKATTLGSKKTGDTLNIEFDIIGKYCARLFQKSPALRISEEFLRRKGF